LPASSAAEPEPVERQLFARTRAGAEICGTAPGIQSHKKDVTKTVFFQTKIFKLS
jgi:hypothetical protein